MNFQDTGAQTLVVMNKVEFFEAANQFSVGPQAKGEWLSEGSGRCDQVLQHVESILKFAESRNSKRIRHSI